jgi:phosphatidylserine/phosphatidylglycerophosphate/cardiolipin synthase-like enzyme
MSETTTEAVALGAVRARAYRSPSLVLLALDWPDGEARGDFLGFAIRRTPGFQDLATGRLAEWSWLPNRVNFRGPPGEGKPDFPSNEAPIQKFMWWDARLEGIEPDVELRYDISAVTGTSAAPVVESSTTTPLTVTLPEHVEFGIGTWFNRAVMSSQAFSRKVKALNLDGGPPTKTQARELRGWLANGMEKPVPDFIARRRSVVGAIYHLTDDLWIIPALRRRMRSASIELIYDARVKKKDGVVQPNPNEGAVAELTGVTFHPRKRANIMHNKFLVTGDDVTSPNGRATRVTMGSANYTTGGLTSQANLVHTFDSPDLATLYLERFRLLQDDPTLKNTKAVAGWSRTISVGDAGVRAFFSPEPGDPGDTSVSIETIVRAIHGAQSSVIFCLFTPTDRDLRDACFSVGDAGKMMFGLVNNIVNEPPQGDPDEMQADELAALEIYHRSRDVKDVIDGSFFSARHVPAGFDAEVNIFPGGHPAPYPEVIIHHKFVIIDAETDSPTIFTGSANMSGNSAFKNDENLLEIKGSPRLARIYLAEFMRLYEHYRARARFIEGRRAGRRWTGFRLAKDGRWARKHYTPGTPEYKARTRMLSLV